MNKTFLKYDDGIVMICPNAYRDRVLEWCRRNKKLLNISFMSREDYFRKLFFDYDTDTLLYLVKNKGLSVSNARSILDDLRFVDGRTGFGIRKLDELSELYGELKQEDLLKRNSHFKERMSRMHLIYAGYGLIDPYTRSLLTGKSVDIIADRFEDKQISVNEYENDENETAHLYYQISRLLLNGIDITKIHLLADHRYDALIRRYNSYYPFEIDLNDNESLYGTKLAQDFLGMLEEGDRTAIYDQLVKTPGNVSDQLISILNRYAAYQLSDVKELIEDDIKKSSVRSAAKENIVSRCSLYEPLEDDEYLFVLGFDDKFASFKRNDIRLDDTVRPLLGLPAIAEENELIRLSICGYLSSISNLFLSCARQTAFAKNGTQNLFDDCKITPDSNRYSLSEAGDRVAYAYALDDLRKFGVKDKELGAFYRTYGDNGYDSYDNRFGKIKDPDFEPALSYSSMNSFYKCPFSYYLRYILGVKDTGDTVYTRFGSLAHAFLKWAIEDRDCDLESLWNELDEKYPSESGMEKQLRLILKEELFRDIEIIKDQHQLTSLNKRLFESEFKTDADGVVFKGFIDKLLYSETDDEVLFTFIDYKTGSSDRIEEKLMPYGLSLQLPAYLYLLKNGEQFKNRKLRFGGIYLQHIISANRNYIEGKTLDDQKRESMKLEGYSTADTDRLRMVDTSLVSEDKSEVVKSLAFKKGGTDFYAYSKVLSDEESDEMIANVANHIKAAAAQIRKGEFTITSKVIEGKERSCAFCPYEDICYRRNSDTVYFDREEE